MEDGFNRSTSRMKASGGDTGTSARAVYQLEPIHDSTKSESGAPIYEHKAEDKKEFALPDGDENIDEISAHIERHIGKIDNVFHELVSDKVHIDIHIINPTEDRPYYTLVTSGMSDKRMNAPENVGEEWTHSELCICLPESWKMGQDEWEDNNNYWPIYWLKMLARFPHQYDTWISWGHTIPNGDPAEPFAENTKMTTMMLMTPLMFGEGFRTLELEGKTINFLNLVPLYDEEVTLKLKEGAEALFDGFDKLLIDDIIHPDRPNTVAPPQKEVIKEQPKVESPPKKKGFFARLFGK